ncbi:MAG: N-acetylmuramoyl-L-alanine amidase [Gaiellaceae bacterium]
MRTLAAALLVAAAAPAVAQGGVPPVRMVVRDVPLSSARSLAAATPEFNVVGLHWQGTGRPQYRARSVSGRWGPWTSADDDWGRVGSWRRGNPDWVGASDAIQTRRVGQVRHLREYLLWSPPVAVTGRRLQLAGSPQIITRTQWEADESIRRAAPEYSPALQLAIVHHTVNTNAYSCSDSASIVRGIMAYHVQSNGWNDIGYNFLIDRCGNVFEGRYGGVDKNVVGAHALGFNRNSVGIALIGTFDSVKPTDAQLAALEKLIAWRLDVAHVDPASTVSYISGGNAKFHAGTTVSLRAVSGHRDVYATDCPGTALYGYLPAVAQAVAKTGLPKLYAPVVTGSLGGPIQFSGMLSSALPWTITVADATGATVATGSGTGTAIDWTWDASAATAGGYSWTMAAGSTVRPATGTFGAATATALALTSLKATPPLLDDTLNPSASITYTLSAAANVTGELLNSAGTAVAQLFAQDLPAGPQTYVFSSSGVPDGDYTIRLTARDALGHTVQATVPVVVSRTLLAFTADTKLVSPNGDGRRDTANFTISLAQSGTIALSLVTGTTTYPLFSGSMTAGDQEWPWSGETLDGSVVPDGTYRATISVGTPPLAVTQSVPLTIDTTPPTLSLVSYSPLRFKTNEKVSVLGTVNGARIATSAKPGVFRIVFKGTVRTLHVVVRDAAGNESLPVNRPLR